MITKINNLQRQRKRNNHISKFKSHEFNVINKNDEFILELSKYGFVLLKQNSLIMLLK